MPDQTAVKLLYDHNDGDGVVSSIATWSGPTSRRSSAGVIVSVITAFLMFVLGVLVGAFLHALAFPDGGSPLILRSFAQNESVSNDLLPNHSPSTISSTSVTALYEDVSSTGIATSKGAEEEAEMATKRVEPLRKLNEVDGKEEGEEEKEEDDDDDDDGDCKNFPWKSFRLPRDIVPLSYNLTIHPNITTHNVTGSLAIDLKVMDSTKLIVLHAHNLVMNTFSLSVNGRRMEAEFYFCTDTSQWAFAMDEAVKVGDIVDLGIEFHGEVLPDLQGLYISTHTDTQGRKTRSAVTQFEPSYARKMFPCFDEPNFKATFEVSVIREPQHVVRSNMKLKHSEEHVDGLYIDVFHRTVKMSTYLLAVAILDKYDYVKKTTINTEKPIEVRLYAPKDMIKGHTEFGLDTAVRALEYFENYFNISYPLDKMDLLALDDFSEGAMENWGLVTFRDSTILYNKQTTNAQTKEQIALIICHEVAHQWFGNLVTMDWWNDLWLNEGFANYMEYRCVNKLFPDWNIMTRFYSENIAYSQEPDGLRSSRAISSITANNTNLMSLFDAINYHKAAAIIRMLQSLAGEKNFQRALVQYLGKYAYGNAKGSQLWKMVEKNAALPYGISISDLANAYITQVGYPMIYVTLSRNEVTVHNQTRFFFEDGMEDDQEWPIPIHYRTDSQTESRMQWIRSDHNKVIWPLEERSKWIIINTGGMSYVKVLYDRRNYAALAKQLKSDHLEISATDRMMILADAFDFAKTSKLSITIYLDLLLYAEEEMDRMTWQLIHKHVKHIEDLIEETSFAHTFKDLQRTLILRPYERIGWESNSSYTPAQKGLQVEVLKMACSLRQRDCVKQAQIRYNEWTAKKKRPSPELHGIVLNEGVRQGGAAAWDRAYNSLVGAKSPTEKYQLIGALASTRDQSLITRLLRLCLDGKTFRPNMVPRVLAELTQNEAARAFTWRFFRVNYKEFVKILGDGSNLLLNSIKAMVDKLSTQEDLDAVKAFLSDKNLEYNKARLDQMYEQIELNIQWRKLNEEPLRRWLESWDEKRRVLYRRRRRSHHLSF
ncbi:unnamed protein product [Cylicocyclus nassatus]|uniref:Aminopeptidase n=1 Tax=Cylicocyclus nassatus TaxID=53992 RepID=A0AA36DU76_CYLNA|nr:unnamed protein product [Cylicocyclus nassatus]